MALIDGNAPGSSVGGHLTAGFRKVIVVSNRLPVSLHKGADGWQVTPSSGGLVAALTPALASNERVWVGWPGDSDEIGDAERGIALEESAKELRYRAVELPKQVAEAHYFGYANRTLWPLFHSFPSKVRYDPVGWEAYRSANELFLQSVLDVYEPGAAIWVHDYHLMLLPSMLRKALPDAAIGFFLHVPFPSSEVFRILPGRQDLLEGMLGADLIGFQTLSHIQNFRNSVLRVCKIHSRLHDIPIGGRCAKLKVLPIGIDHQIWRTELASKESKRALRRVKQQYAGKKLVLSVDRLDYTKGIPSRLRAFRKLLENHPELHHRVVFVQIAVPSREGIEAYDSLAKQIDELVGEINGRFGAVSWTPVTYIHRSVSRRVLAALYKAADVCWVSPLRDGMNLVSKEYVACKSKADGVLVLSEFAGAAEELGEAIIVNPYDDADQVEALLRALEMQTAEKSARLAALRAKVTKNDCFSWAQQFVRDLAAAADERGKSHDEPVRLPLRLLKDDYGQATRRLLLLDYDGTLTEHVANPADAKPSPTVLSLLRALTDDPDNSVMLLSGRRSSELEEWFGSIPYLHLGAEHGGVLKLCDGNGWRRVRPEYRGEVMPQVEAIMRDFVDRAPGTSLESKELSIVWHYRNGDPPHCEWLAQELVLALSMVLAESELRAMHGDKLVEVRPTWMHKGMAATVMLEREPDADFVMALGNDATDEDMFEALGDYGWTIHVGPNRSTAKYWVWTAAQVRRLLGLLCVNGAQTARSLPKDRILVDADARTPREFFSL